MYGARQLRVVAVYDGDCSFLCKECALKEYGLDDVDELNIFVMGDNAAGGSMSLVQALEESDWGDGGMYCDKCGAEIFEPYEDEEEGEEEE